MIGAGTTLVALQPHAGGWVEPHQHCESKATATSVLRPELARMPSCRAGYGLSQRCGRRVPRTLRGVLLFSFKTITQADKKDVGGIASVQMAIDGVCVGSVSVQHLIAYPLGR